MENSIIQFVNGMKLHDFAKPFSRSGKRHSIVGFFMLEASGRESESLYSLLHHMHGGVQRNYAADILQAYRQNTGHALALSIWLCFSSAMDQLAASTFTGAGGTEPSLEFWSVQNPFSRLPVIIGDRSDLSYGYGEQSLESNLHDFLWQLTFDTEIDLEDVRSKLTANAPENVFSLREIFVASEFSREKIRELANDILFGRAKMNAHGIFPERTYPSANDVSLLQHGRFASALSFVVAGNVARRPMAERQAVFGDLEAACEVIAYGNDLGEQERKAQWGKFNQASLDNLGCRVVKIGFERLQTLYESGIRLDDIHGAKKFIDKIMTSYVVHFGNRIFSLITETESENFPLEPFNWFAFELVYLLPESISAEEIKTASDSAFHASLQEQVDTFERLFKKDFKADRRIVDLFDKNRILGYAGVYKPICTVSDVESLEEDVSNEGRIKSQFSHNIGKAYKKALDDKLVAPNDIFIPDSFKDENSLKEPVCEVCGSFSSFREFYRLYDGFSAKEECREAAQSMEAVMYGLKEEAEQLCDFCLCLRLLSHGEVRVGWLDDNGLLKIEERDSETCIVKCDPTADMDIPPKMLARVIVEKNSKTPVDMGACFVRVTEVGDGKGPVKKILQAFPTIYAAADSDSNVAMLHLEPNMDEGILGEYDLREKLYEPLKNCAYEKIIGEDETGDEKFKRLLADMERYMGKDFDNSNKQEFRKWFESEIGEYRSNDFARLVFSWQAYVKTLEAAGNKGDFLDDAFAVIPRMARILTRIRFVEDFFGEFAETLSEKGNDVRAVTIESRFPRLTLLFPAKDTVKVLNILHRKMARCLFSSNLHSAPEASEKESWSKSCLWALEKALPPVLSGALSVFKAKQPLYHVMDSAREITRFLNESSGLGGGSRLGFADHRGLMGVMNRGHIEQIPRVDFFTLFELLRVESRIGRKALATLETIKATELGQAPQGIEAWAFLRKGFEGWSDRETAAILNPETRMALSFLKTVSKAGSEKA